MLELDPLDSAVASELDHRLDAVPGIVEEERAVASDRLELVTLGKSRPAVELCDDVTGKAHRTGENPVGAAGADVLLPVHLVRLAREQAGAADAVAADVHQAAALDIRSQTDVLRVVQRIAEARADEPEVPDRTLVDELTQACGLRVVPVHERLHQDPSAPLGGVERRLDIADMLAHRLLAEHVLAGLD